MSGLSASYRSLPRLAGNCCKRPKRLRERNRQKDDFIATLGHELRNPLGAIVAATSVLQQRAANDQGAVRALDIIARQSKHMARLADDLLDVARIESGQLELDRRVVDVRAIVAETVESRRAQIERRRHSLNVEIGADPILIDGDPVRLAQVVSNLVDNAAKYTPEQGTITVALSVEGAGGGGDRPRHRFWHSPGTSAEDF